MENNLSFSYHYSASENKEILEIRKKYLPREESKFDEIKRLDNCIQTAGQLPSLTIGIVSCLVFGLGLCLVLKVIGESLLLGIIIGIIGLIGMLTAYPVYRKVFSTTKAKLVPKILELSSDLAEESSNTI